MYSLLMLSVDFVSYIIGLLLSPLKRGNLNFGLELEGQCLLKVDRPHRFITGDLGRVNFSISHGENKGSGQGSEKITRDL